VVEQFRLLGRSVAKALQDNRLLDMPLNPVFFRAVLGKPLDLYDVAEVDPGLGASLERLARAAAAHAAAGGDGPLMVDGCLVDDLCLTFTLPGEWGCGCRTSKVVTAGKAVSHCWSKLAGQHA
jgi:E3 ubiquitin-protein ligase TRIP12